MREKVGKRERVLRKHPLPRGLRRVAGVGLPLPSQRAMVFGLAAAGNYLLAVLEDGRLMTWDLKSRNSRTLRGGPTSANATAVAVEPSGQMALVGDAEGYLHRLDVASGRIVKSM